MTTVEIALLIASDAFWSGLAAIGFAIMFNIPKRLLPYCLVTGALGHSIRTLILQSTPMNLVMATFFAAMIVGFVGFRLARHLKAPSVIFSVTGVLPMVPGKLAYTAMIALVSIPEVSNDPVVSAELIQSALTNLIQLSMILGALGLGIVAPALIIERTKPVV